MSLPEARDERLAEALASLGNPSRIALLRALRTARTLNEIEMRIEAGPTGDRAVSRQGVKKHLERLVEQGIVLTRETERPYGPTVEYLVNHQRLFALSEEFRSLARLRPLEEPDAVTSVAPGEAARPPDGPALLLVKGLDEGTAFELTPPGPRGGWVIGRRRDAEVSLDFDPYVSSDNALVVWDGARHLLQDHASSRNGTQLNFTPLRKGEATALRHGDLILVGRSILSYRRP